MKFRLLFIFLFSPLVSPLYAASFDCSKATTDIENAICADPKLGSLDELASILSSYVGLDINFKTSDLYIEDLADYYAFQISRLMKLISIKDATKLHSYRLEYWNLELNLDHRYLIFRPRVDNLQEGMILFGANNSTDYAVMEPISDAGKHVYNFSKGILETKAKYRPATITTKYRFEDDCWRLIGRDTIWAEYMIEFSDDLKSRSINYLTGKQIIQFANGNIETKMTDVIVSCLRN